MWYKGFTHYHTGFHYLVCQRINPRKLREEFQSLGASFVFCAGDHGDNEGNHFWGWGEEYQDYKALCLKESTPDFLFIPSLEMHIRFSDPPQRKEHHSCIPGMNALEDAGLSTPQPYPFVSLTPDPKEFISKTSKKGLSPILNHPHLSTISAFNGPDSLSVPAFYGFSYLELFTADWPNCFSCDFSLYLKFLADPRAAAMACCSGIDNAMRPTLDFLQEPGITNVTYLHILEGTLTREGLLKAWGERRTYAVHGNLHIEKIDPVPSRRLIRTTHKPNISLTVCHQEEKKIAGVEIYRNGIKVYEEKSLRKGTCSLNWEDRKPKEGKNHYIIHAETEEEHLITSPVNYLVE